MKGIIHPIKAAYLMLVSCFFMLQLSAQEKYLYWKYTHTSESYESLDFVGELGGDYIAIGAISEFIGSKQDASFNRLNSSGNVLTSSTLDYDSLHIFLGYYGSGFVVDDRKIIFGGSSLNLNLETSYNPTIFVFDNQGNAEILNVILRDSSCGFNQGKLAHDGNYIFIGQSTEFDPAGDYYVVKTDTLGNILWERRYGTPYYDNGLSINLTPDGGYVLYGSSDGYGAEVGSYSDALLIKIDDNGSIEWQKTWGGDYSDCNWNVEVTVDGDIVTFGCVTAEYPTSLRGYVRKMDEVGNLLWDKMFERDLVLGYPRVFFSGRILDNGQIIAAGQGSIAFSDSNAHNAPWTVIFDADGTVLSNRGYTSIFTGPMSNAQFEDIRPTSDGGFIAGGKYLPRAGDTGNQDMFVLKLDSAGCEYPQCQPPLSVAEPVAPKSLGFSAYPNPFNSGITFDVGSDQVSEIVIMDIRGVLVDRLTVGKNQPMVEWNTVNLDSGIYIATISSAKGAQSLKVIKY